MKKIVVDDYNELSSWAGRLVAEKIKNNPTITLGLATGSTPIGLYGKIVEEYQEGRLDCSGVTTFNLDEYCGLAGDHPQSYRFFMDEQLFRHINIDRSRVHFPGGEEGDNGYERKIKEAGGIDLQILGIGRNGHIGFNEPGSSFTSRTRVVDLTETTMEDNARFFMSKEDVPHRAVTMGLMTIMEAREILLLASGENKREAVRRACQEEPTENVPASVLQNHRAVTVVVDKAAAGFEV